MSNYWHVVQVLLAVLAADKIHATLDICKWSLKYVFQKIKFIN